MNNQALIFAITSALALPFAALAADPMEPGKSGDAVTTPTTTTTAPTRGASSSMSKEPDRETGKSGDGVKTTDLTTETRMFSGSITAVSMEDKTIMINDATKGTHKLHVGDTTKLMKGEKTGNWSDLKVGAKVEGTCRGSMEQAHAQTLNIGE